MEKKLTTVAGAPVVDNQNALTAGPRGPMLLQDVWEMSSELQTRTVDTHVKRLREKLGTEGRDLIETVRGVGYRMIDPSERE